MNTLKKKKTTQIKKQQKARVRLEMPKSKSVGITSPQDNLKACWKEETSKLLSMRFSSMEEAVCALIDSVLDRLEIKGNSRKETASYLSFLFETDESLHNELQRIVKVKNG